MSHYGRLQAATPAWVLTFLCLRRLATQSSGDEGWQSQRHGIGFALFICATERQQGGRRRCR
jgi:hypothetical protein